MERIARAGGRELRVRIEECGDWLRVDHDGVSRMASVAPAGPSVYSILIDGESYAARVDGGRIVVNGRQIPLELIDPRDGPAQAPAAEAGGRETIAPRMPGKVVRVLAALGDSVIAGQGIVVLEAMKMQNELKTRKAGVVVLLAAREGQTVAAGETLAEVESVHGGD